MAKRNSLDQLVEEFQIFHCVECGKCTGACPLAQVDRQFSPRLLARCAIDEGLGSPYLREGAWACLTCGLCRERCPAGIRFEYFIHRVRLLYFEEDGRSHLGHGGALQAIMRMQVAPKLKQNRAEWITPQLRTSSSGEVLYFVGCLPYFDAFFSDLHLNLTDIAVHTVKILNSLGVAPVVLQNERCCGHDLFWSGDVRSFEALRRLNLDSFHRTGVTTIVTSCAECSFVLKDLYADDSGNMPFEVMHLSDYVRKMDPPSVRRSERVATYQDPCRLGRFQGVFEAPRELISAVALLREMPHSGRGSWCCGNSAWLGCDRYSKQMQVERLLEALSTGNDTLVTACPKCQVHLACTMKDANLLRDLHMNILDLSSLLAEAVTAG